MQYAICGLVRRGIGAARFARVVWVCFLILGALVFFSRETFAEATLPTPPQTFDTTYSAPTGSTCTAANISEFQTCLNNAPLNSTIVLQAGTVYQTTSPIVLPNKTSGSGWIYIVSSNLVNLPAAGTRVSPANAANMPKIVAPPYQGAIGTASAAHHYRFVGIEFRPTTGNYAYQLVYIGNNESTISALPTDITFDRCYFHGDLTAGTRRGLIADGIRVAAIDSYFSDFVDTTGQTQNILAFNTPGPIKIVNNYLSATAQSINFGGANAGLPSPYMPSDIEIRRNHFFKPLSWLSGPYETRHHLEFKVGKRVIVEGNIFENNFSTTLPRAFSIMISPRSEDGRYTWWETSDIMIRNNKFINVGDGIAFTGHDGGVPPTTPQTKRVAFTNNLLQVAKVGTSNGYCMQFIVNPSDVLIDHNTMSCPYMISVSQNDASFSGYIDNLEFKNNITQRGEYGFYNGSGEGTRALNAQFGSTWIFSKNAIWGNSGIAGIYPANNYFPANIDAVGFVDYANGNYRLAASSPYKNAGSDGKDLGADIDAIEEETSCSVSGQCGSSSSPVACNTITPANFSQSTYNSYGAPFDPFTSNTPLVNVTCTSADTNTINLTTGITGDTTRIIYTKGYWYDSVGTAWRQYTGTCTGALNGDWCQGSVSATIMDANVSTASAASPTYFVGMVCRMVLGEWKCGCRDTTCNNFLWQIQGAGL